MGWFGKKEQVRRDPQTGLMLVKVGDTWIQEHPEIMVLRDFRKYFRDREIDFVDAVYLTAHFCGFLVGSANELPTGTLVHQPNVQELAKQAVAAGMEAGIEAGRQAQDPAITAQPEKAGGSK